jgi:6-phosphogluconolactonase (cycloisomerase 2 family)
LLLTSHSVSASASAPASAQQFLYVNFNDFFDVTNRVEGFRVSPAGTLTRLKESPFFTGGKTGTAGGAYAGRTLAVSPNGRYLYAANQGTADISVFTVNQATGGLTVSPTRYAVFPNQRSQVGATMAMTPNGKFLFAASGSLFDLRTFAITPSGALRYAAVPLAPLSGQALDMVVTRDNKFLLVTDESKDIQVFSISSKGALTEVAGSPFPTFGEGAGMTMDCSGERLYLGDGQKTGTVVEALSIAKDGTLTPLPGSPFDGALGNNSNTVLLSVDGKFLYVGNQYSSAVSSFSVADDGSLTEVPTSPFFDDNLGDQPSQMALSPTGGLLFVAGTPFGSFPSVDVFKTSADGTLDTVPGSPFLLGVNADPFSLVTIPGPSCTP